jgi:hypothetical protein
MLKDKLTIAAHVSRKSGPWIGAATMLLVGINDLRSKKNV